MNNTLNFFLEIDKLKTTPRTGLVWLGVRNPETIAAHTFRCATTAWVLGRGRGFDMEKLIKTALSHDLNEVYTGDMTPFWGLLPEDEEQKKEALKKWVRLPLEEKEKRNKKRFQKEKESLLKLTNKLDEEFRRDIFSLWLDFEKGSSREGRFFKQIDKIDSMIEALENLDKKDYSFVTPWWEEADELVTDPLLLKFLKVIQDRFYDKKVEDFPEKKELMDVLEFLLEVGKLKKMPRFYWMIRGIDKPETVASHIFTLSFMAWIMGSKINKFNIEKLLKMTLFHEMSAVYAGDITRYNRVLSNSSKEKGEILEKWIRLSQREKAKNFSASLEKEERALKKLVSSLKKPLQKEIVYLWKEYKTKGSPEAQFLSQLDVLCVLLQALLYAKEEENFSPKPLWEWAFEQCDRQVCFDFFDAVKEEFY